MSSPAATLNKQVSSGDSCDTANSETKNDKDKNELFGRRRLATLTEALLLEKYEHNTNATIYLKKAALSDKVHADVQKDVTGKLNVKGPHYVTEIGDAKALEGYRYRILDALGKEVYNELVKNALTEIPLKTLGAAGMYQLDVLDANKTSIQTNKIVLQ